MSPGPASVPAVEARNIEEVGSPRVAESPTRGLPTPAVRPAIDPPVAGIPIRTAGKIPPASVSPGGIAPASHIPAGIRSPPGASEVHADSGKPSESSVGNHATSDSPGESIPSDSCRVSRKRLREGTSAEVLSGILKGVVASERDEAISEAPPGGIHIDSSVDRQIAGPIGQIGPIDQRLTGPAPISEIPERSVVRRVQCVPSKIRLSDTGGEGRIRICSPAATEVQIVQRRETRRTFGGQIPKLRTSRPA